MAASLALRSPMPDFDTKYHRLGMGRCHFLSKSPGQRAERPAPAHTSPLVGQTRLPGHKAGGMSEVGSLHLLWRPAGAGRQAGVTWLPLRSGLQACSLNYRAFLTGEVQNPMILGANGPLRSSAHEGLRGKHAKVTRAGGAGCRGRRRPRAGGPRPPTKHKRPRPRLHQPDRGRSLSHRYTACPPR